MKGVNSQVKSHIHYVHHFEQSGLGLSPRTQPCSTNAFPTLRLCNREEQICFHVRFLFYFTLCILLLSLQVKNVAYGLRQTGRLVVKALTLKCMALFHSYRARKLQNTGKHLSCWRLTGKPWPELGGQLQEQRASRNLQQPTLTWPLSLLCWNPREFEAF